jgi:hypothetical protein
MDPLPSESCFKFLQQSLCQLIRFTLHDPDLDENTLHACLTSLYMESLLELDVRARITDLTVNLLTPIPENHCRCDKPGHLLPKLRILKFSTYYATDGVYSRMVAAQSLPIEEVSGFFPFSRGAPRIQDIENFQGPESKVSILKF